MLVVNSLCKNIFLIFFSNFPVFSLSGKMDFQIPCAVAILLLSQPWSVISMQVSTVSVEKQHLNARLIMTWVKISFKLTNFVFLLKRSGSLPKILGQD